MSLTAVSTPLLNISRDGDSTSSLGRLECHKPLSDLWTTLLRPNLRRSCALTLFFFFPPEIQETTKTSAPSEIAMRWMVGIRWVVMPVKQIARALLLKHDRSMSEMWKQRGAVSHVGFLKAKYSSCLSCPEPINEMTVWIVWIWPADWHYLLSPAQLKIKLRRTVLKACCAEVIALFLL